MTMIVRGMRWGYDGGGFACGPVEGNTLVEIMVKGNDNLHHYVFVSRMSEFEQIRITSMPVFDIAMWMDRSKVDSDAEWKKIEDVTEEMYDYEIYEPDKDMRKSQYVKAIDLARAAMVECYGSEDQSAEAANAFIEEYCDEDIDKMDIPEVIEKNEYEDYEDDEELEEIDFTNLPMEEIYKLRMRSEVKVRRPSIFKDMDGDHLFESTFDAVKSACDSEENYRVWEESYLKEQKNKYKDIHFITCKYAWAGFGQYEQPMPEEKKDEFIEWINGNGSAFYGGERKATPEEIDDYFRLSVGIEE